MLSALKAEFTKLLTVRSTYFLTLFVCLIVAGISTYSGYHDIANVSLNLQAFVFGALQFVGFIAAIIAVLMVAHEYRYNVITYSFTLSNSRSKVLAAKFATATVAALVLCLLTIGLVVGGLQLGGALHGGSLTTAGFDWLGVFGQALFYVWGYAMAGLIITLLLRNLVASVAFLFIFPTLEQLAGLILKDNVNYLPFISLNAVVPVASGQGGFGVGKSVIIFAIYLAVFGVAAWLSTLKRDAN